LVNTKEMKPNILETQIRRNQLMAEDRHRERRKCPVCSGIELILEERKGVELDLCPRCRGVWLDRGELEKIIERAQEPQPRSRARHAPGDPRESRPRRSWLRELFE
jgi:uncharacterized protein